MIGLPSPRYFATTGEAKTARVHFSLLELWDGSHTRGRPLIARAFQGGTRWVSVMLKPRPESVDWSPPPRRATFGPPRKAHFGEAGLKYFPSPWRFFAIFPVFFWGKGDCPWPSAIGMKTMMSAPSVEGVGMNSLSKYLKASKTTAPTKECEGRRPERDAPGDREPRGQAAGRIEGRLQGNASTGILIPPNEKLSPAGSKAGAREMGASQAWSAMGRSRAGPIAKRFFCKTLRGMGKSFWPFLSQSQRPEKHRKRKRETIIANGGKKGPGRP